MLRSVAGVMGIMVLSLKLSLTVKTLEVRLGESVTMQCDLSYHYQINWLRIKSENKPELLMVMGLNHNGELSVTWNSNISSFQGFVKNRLVLLKIGQVKAEDLITYFCTAINDKRIEFGEGVRLYAILDMQQHLDQNLTHCPEGSFHTHMIFSGVLCGCVLLMFLTVIAVHVMTCEGRLC